MSALGAGSPPPGWFRWSQIRGNAADPALVSLAQEFVSTISAPAFPCPFAVGAVSRDELVLTRASPSRPMLDQVATRMVEAAKILADEPTTVGVLFVPLTVAGNETGEVAFATELLNRLRQQGAADWPPHVPTDPNHHRWSLWLEGVDLFLNISSPGHGPRRSRNLGRCMTLLVQWRGAFDEYPSGHPIRQHIRARLADYDEMPAHPALGGYGDEQNLEVAQYYLGSTNRQTHTLDGSD